MYKKKLVTNKCTLMFSILHKVNPTFTHTHPHRIDSILLPLLISIKHEFFNISTVANVDCFYSWNIFRGCYRKQKKQEAKEHRKKGKIKC